MSENIYLEHRDDFIKFVVDNQEKIRKAVRKNITMDADIFDDVTGDTIVKICDYIVKNKKFINDFNSFFFICAKRNYIITQNKKRNHLKNDDNNFLWNVSHGMELKARPEDVRKYNELIDDGERYDESKMKKINKLFNYISDRLNQYFTPRDCDIYLIYYRLKSEKSPVSYKKLAKIMDIPLKEVTSSIQKCKKFVRSDAEILNYKKKLLNDD